VESGARVVVGFTVSVERLRFRVEADSITIRKLHRGSLLIRGD